jgi:hypothetical protein
VGSITFVNIAFVLSSYAVILSHQRQTRSALPTPSLQRTTSTKIMQAPYCLAEGSGSCFCVRPIPARPLTRDHHACVQ